MNPNVEKNLKGAFKFLKSASCLFEEYKDGSSKKEK